jgi:hypothetical protein
MTYNSKGITNEIIPLLKLCFIDSNIAPLIKRH